MSTWSSPWPDGHRAAVSITMDNMGEAAAIQRGEWPHGEPVGRHYTVTEALPNLLDLFDELGVRITYFIEAWNVRHYPEIILDVNNRGHEVAMHGWQHERWHRLDREQESELTSRSVEVFRGLGLDVTGFRPPGGVLTADSPDILGSNRIDYCSPAGEQAAIADGLVYLPFEWQAVDAYYYSPGFADLRSLKGDPPGMLAPSDMAERVSERIHERIESGGYLAILFHPFLEVEPERIAVLVEIARSLLSDERVWCAPCRDIATWIRAHPERYSGDPMLDTSLRSR